MHLPYAGRALVCSQIQKTDHPTQRIVLQGPHQIQQQDYQHYEYTFTTQQKVFSRRIVPSDLLTHRPGAERAGESVQWRRAAAVPWGNFSTP